METEAELDSKPGGVAPEPLHGSSPPSLWKGSIKAEVSTKGASACRSTEVTISNAQRRARAEAVVPLGATVLV